MSYTLANFAEYRRNLTNDGPSSTLPSLSCIHYINMTDDCTFPEGFGGIGGRTFAWVRDNKKEWCRFTVDTMQDTTGFFKVWQTYLINHNAAKNEIELRPTGCESRPTN